jgi:hypothetical protein
MPRHLPHRLRALAALAAAALALPAHAATRTWVCTGTQNFNNGGCWANGLGPLAGDDAVLSAPSAAAAVTVRFPGAVANPNAAALDLYRLAIHGGSAAQPIQLVHEAGHLGTQLAEVGFGYNGMLVVRNGAFTAENLLLGRGAGEGRLILDAPASQVHARDLVVGYLGGTGVVQHDAGVVRTSALLVGAGSTYMLGAGTLVVDGVFDVSGSYVQNSGVLDLLTLRTDALRNSGSLVFNGGGVMNGNVRNEGNMEVNHRLDLNALGNLGTLKTPAAGALMVGSFVNHGGATVQMRGGVLSLGAQVNLGTIVGHGALDTAAPLDNQGRLEVSDGNLSASGIANRGVVQLSAGRTLTLTGGATTGLQNRGMLDLAGGHIDATGAAFVSNLSEGVVVGSGRIDAFFSNPGVVHVLAGKRIEIVRGFDNAGQVHLAGGGVLAGGPVVNRGTIGGSGRVDAHVHNTAQGHVVASMGASLSLAGFYEAEAGSEQRADAAGVLFFLAGAALHDGAFITGSGVASFAQMLDVGNSPGLAGVQGNAVFEPSLHYNAQIGGTAAGIDFDQFRVGGSLVLGGTLTLSAWNGFVAHAGQSFRLFDAGHLAGGFTTLQSTLPLAEGARLDWSRLALDGTVAVVPEPAAWLLTALGLPMLWARRTRA